MKLLENKIMGQLDEKAIEKLASGKGVRRIAVENFLYTVKGNPTEYAAMANLAMDAKLYKWNPVTRQAIAKGIKLAYRG